MGSNNNKNQPQQQQQGYGPNPGTSGTDPRGRVQNQIGYQQQRYENQQGPLANTMAMNYGRGSEADFGDRTNIMNQYMDIASGGGSGNSGDGGGGGAASNYSAFTVNPERVNASQANAQYANTERAAPARQLGPLERVTASDPYNSYAGMQEFSQTGGYSPQDTANMRARGIAPIRAAYDAAARNVGQQRSLQGGYSPNAIAAQVKMAREQGQSMADAGQNVEAGIAQARNQGRLAGLQGMGNIESNRQQAQMQGDIFNAGQANQGQQFDISNEMNTNQFNAGQGNQVGMFNAGQGNDVGMFNAGQSNDVGKYNAGLNYQGQTYNADAQTQAQARNNASAEAAASRAASSAAQNNDDRLRALAGASNLYGTTPGASQLFGNQAINIVGQGGNMGLGYIGAQQGAGQQQGAFDQTMNRAGQITNAVGTGLRSIYPFLDNNSQPGTPPPSFSNRVTQNFDPRQYGQQIQMSQPPFNPYGQTYDEGDY